MKLGKAAETVAKGAEETFTYYAFPLEHWRLLRTNNPLERINREIRRRTRLEMIPNVQQDMQRNA